MDPEVSFPEHWAPPPELARALPREVRMSGTGLFIGIFAVLLIVAAFPLFLFMREEATRQTARNQMLRERGVEATGEIVKLWHEGRSSTPWVAYAFTANGIRMHGEASVPKSLWDHIRVAGMIPIRYLPADPSINHPAAWEADIAPLWVSFVLPAMLLLCAGVFLANHRKQSTLLAAGLPAPAVIARCYRVKNGWAANFRFRTQDGAVVAGRCTIRRKVEIGTALCVLYDPQNPQRARVYPMDWYRLA
jgi:hypothetical protein